MIDESVKNAQAGVDISKDVTSALEEISNSVAKSSDLVSEIAAASQEQSQGIDQVNTAMAQMDKVTQQNAANAEESASASEELNAQAEGLQGMVAEFSLSNTGHRSAQNTHSLSKSDHVFHSIADGSDNANQRPKAQAVTTKAQAKKAIPLDDETSSTDDFSEFNN